MSMRIEPLQPDLLIAIYAIHKFYKELGKNPEWLTKKEQFKKKTIGENRCGELEYEVVSPILWDCVSFFFEEEKCIERIRYVDFIVCELFEIIHGSKPKDFDCTINLTAEWETMIQKDQEKLHNIKNVHFIVDKEEGEALKLLSKRFADAKKKADKKPNVYPRKIIPITFPFRLAYQLSADIFRCLRFEIKKIEDKNSGVASPFDVVELLTTYQPIDLRLFENKKILSPILEKFLEAYFQKLREGSLFESNVLRWDLQKQKLAQQLRDMEKDYGSKFYLNRDPFAMKNIELSDFKPIETLLAMDQEGSLSIKSFRLQEPKTMNKWEDPTRVVEIEVQLPKGGINNPNSSSLTDQPFRFGNSLTTFKPYRIWKEGHEGSGQNLSNAKRRYIWEFCSKSCNQGLQAQELLDKYVREAMQSKGNTESIKVTYDDIKTLIELIAQYSDVPRKTLREHIKFKEGVGIEVKSI